MTLETVLVIVAIGSFLVAGFFFFRAMSYKNIGETIFLEEDAVTNALQHALFAREGNEQAELLTRIFPTKENRYEEAVQNVKSETTCVVLGVVFCMAGIVIIGIPLFLI